MRLLNDSRGKKSWSLTLAVPACIAITAWFLVGGLDVTVGSVHVVTATKDASQYALAVGVWLAFFGHRETVEKKLNGGA